MSRFLPDDAAFADVHYPRRGMHLAENSIYINIARILWAFNISKAKDASGNDIPVDIFEFTDGALSPPSPRNAVANLELD